MKLVDIKPWGPPKLQKILQILIDAINERTHVGGLGIDIDETPAGAVHNVADQIASLGDTFASTGGGTGGTTVNIFGQLNGQPATYHLLQSSAPTPLTEEEP